MTSELKSKPKSATAKKTAKSKSDAADSLQAGAPAAKLNSAAEKRTASGSPKKTAATSRPKDGGAVAEGKIKAQPKVKTGSAAEVKVRVQPKGRAGGTAEGKVQPKVKAGNASVVKAKAQPKVKAGSVVGVKTTPKPKAKGLERAASSSAAGKVERPSAGRAGSKTAKAIGSSPKVPKVLAASKSKGSTGTFRKDQFGRPTGRELAELVAAAAGEHKPVNPVLLDLSALSSVADWFFIASAENPRQMSAIAEKIIRRARDRGVRPLGHEGLGRGEGHWVLVDLGDVVVHIFNLEARELYDLEGLWTDAPRCQVKI